MSWSLQHILVYLTLAISIGYLVYKFIWPEIRKPKKADPSKGCGSSDCGCH
ncbi:FeoB-associated Cys-rich membrane protein [Robiginitalea sp.]|jgi:hypothetical protein|uniref:FeoB-associated Cys-rich membrane protein n=1 Tax=Robiginitalea sp. TaxID=1902411 RepID=UPI003C768E67